MGRANSTHNRPTFLEPPQFSSQPPAVASRRGLVPAAFSNESAACNCSARMRLCVEGVCVRLCLSIHFSTNEPERCQGQACPPRAAGRKGPGRVTSPGYLGCLCAGGTDAWRAHHSPQRPNGRGDRPESSLRSPPLIPPRPSEGFSLLFGAIVSGSRVSQVHGPRRLERW